MIKILYIIFLSLVVANCSFKNVVKHHGVPFLEKKQASLIINKTNKNEIREILGNPSTKSKFDNDVWIYIERKQTQSKLTNLGKMKIFKNDVLVIELDNYGILKKKEFYNIEDMENMTAFADYIVPVALEKMNIVTYSDKLKNKIEQGVLIESGSIEEIEIRSATLFVTAQLTEEINKLRGVDEKIIIPQLDFKLWTDFHAEKSFHHLTKTIMY